MKIIHYTNGYGGKYNYHTACGEEIHSHSETEDASVDPAKVTCERCKDTLTWIEDVGHSSGSIKTSTKRRIYIESDIVHADEFLSVQREVVGLLEDKGECYIKRVFSEVLDFAWHDLEKTWQSVRAADEIYTQSSLLPLSGGSYIGAPVIFNGMCERALKEGVSGKDVYILNKLEYIHWDMIKIPLMQDAFSVNNLFMYDDNYNMVKIDVKKIKKN